MFIKVSEWDLVRKIIKSELFHLKKLKIFKMKKKNEDELCSTYHITLIFPISLTSFLADLKYITIFFIASLFN